MFVCSYFVIMLNYDNASKTVVPHYTVKQAHLKQRK